MGTFGRGLYLANWRFFFSNGALSPNLSPPNAFCRQTTKYFDKQNFPLYSIYMYTVCYQHETPSRQHQHYTNLRRIFGASMYDSMHDAEGAYTMYMAGINEVYTARGRYLHVYLLPTVVGSHSSISFTTSRCPLRQARCSAMSPLLS